MAFLVFVHRSPKLCRANLTLPPNQIASSSSHNNAVNSNSNSDNLNSSNVSMNVHHFMPRSKSNSQLISSRLEPPRSPSHHSYLNSTNNHSSNHQSRTCRSKSAVNVRLQKEHQQLQHHQYPRVSHHQPCPNHVAGKTFAEMGTQTLPRPKKKVEEPPEPEDEENKGCVASLKQR